MSHPIHLPVGAHPGATGIAGNAAITPRCAPRHVVASASVTAAERSHNEPANQVHPVGAHPGATGVPGYAPVAPRCAPTHVVGRRV
ncbi:hypothetical protein FHR47_001513 [Xanthomonas arboricola]|nr:hypothetical protein [Xanthomonas cannabis]